MNELSRAGLAKQNKTVVRVDDGEKKYNIIVEDVFMGENISWKGIKTC